VRRSVIRRPGESGRPGVRRLGRAAAHSGGGARAVTGEVGSLCFLLSTRSFFLLRKRAADYVRGGETERDFNFSCGSMYVACK
jgi:hypothetical protein